MKRSLVLGTAALLFLAPAVPARDGGGSLEAYLKRVRASREAEHVRLRPLVDDLVKQLGKARSGNELARLQTELVNLGTEVPPLLVPYLDPDATADGLGAEGVRRLVEQEQAEQEKQAQEVAVLLARSKHPALLEDLVHLAGTAGTTGRILAVRVLGDSPEVAGAAAALRALHPEVSGALRAECVRSLARLVNGDPLVVAALSDTHPEVISAGLQALANEPRKKPRAEVLALLADGNRGADVLSDLVDYFSFTGQEVEEESVAQLLRFACRADLPPEARLRVLDGLPRFGVSKPISSRLRKEVEPLLTSSDSALKDAALIALTLLEDPKAKRDLMRFYDDQVDNNKAWPLAYQRRGDVELRIGEYRAAARDYERALELHEDSARLPGNRDLWINLARAHLKDGKPKPAAEALEEFGLTSELKRVLRSDPDFQPLVEHPRYKGLFE